MKLVGWSKNITEDYRKKALNNGKPDFLLKKYLGIGCIERGEGGQAIVEFVPNRKRKTLFKLIKKRIKPKTNNFWWVASVFAIWETFTTIQVYLKITNFLLTQALSLVIFY